MKKNILAAFLCSALAISAAIPVFAASPTSGSAQTTPVEFESGETEWAWEVPAAQTFTDQSLKKNGSVKIKPLNDGDVIILDEGTQIDISLSSINGFKLKNTDKSAIPYEVKKGSTVLVDNDNVLHFEAGVSDNTGVAQTLSFETTEAKIKEAKLIGQHTDTITFSLGVTDFVNVTKEIEDEDAQYVTVPTKVSRGGKLEITASKPDYDATVTANGTVLQLVDGKYTMDNVQSDVTVRIVFASHVHTFGAWVVTEEPTCNTEGTKTQTCTKCGATQTDTVPATGVHNYVDGTCSNCGAVKIVAATFSDGAELSWEELKLPENGEKYGYDASLITDTSIGDSAFKPYYSAPIKSIKIPNGVTSIGDSAFSCCDDLTSVEIPSSVTSIGVYTFEGCDNLTSITFGEGSQLASIGNFAFDSCTSLTSITIPDSVTSIGDHAFYGCTNLTGSITIPDGVTTIEEGTFIDCSSLTSITIGNGVTSIRYQAFHSCTNLTSVIFEEGSQLTSIGSAAFGSCNNLTSITIPNTVTSIGDFAFSSCSKLTDITYTGTQTQWNAINKGTGWNSSTGNYTIHCTDGDIPKS